VLVFYVDEGRWIKAMEIERKAEGTSAPLKPLYVRQMVGSFGNGVIGPYITIYAVQLGASSTEMGWLRSLGNLFGSVMQVPWGAVCDKFRRRVPFIVLGGVLSSLLWLPMLYVKTAWELIVLVALQAFIGSMVAPAWAALIGDMVPQPRRGSVTATINAAASFGSITATLISGYIMASAGGSLSHMYTIPLMLATICGFGASLTMLTLRERKVKELEKPKVQSWINWRPLLKGNLNFRRFCLISVFHSFFMSVAWPLFPITIVKVIKADMVQVAYLSVISGGVSLLVRRFVGRLADRAGRKPLIIVGRAGIALVPLTYAIATSVYHLYTVDFVIGILMAASEIAVFAYLLDVTPEEQRGASVAFFNTMNGFSTFLGSITGGYLTSMLIYVGFEELTSLQIVYGISALGRLTGGLLFLKIEEPYKYPSTMKAEILEIISEDVTKAKEELHRIEERGEAVDREVQKDFEWFESTLRWRKEKEEK